MDFMASYGIALIIIIAAVSVIYIVSSSNSDIFQQSCTAYSGFSCGSFFLTQNGVLNITLAQATGGNVLVNGIACSSTQASGGDVPAYGNYDVFNSFYYYPNNEFANGVYINTGSSASFDLYCYDSSGVAISSTNAGAFVGYIWLNYTILGTNVKTTQLVASFTAQYT